MEPGTRLPPGPRATPHPVARARRGTWSTRDQGDGKGQHEAGGELHKVTADARCRGGNCGESTAASGQIRGETAHGADARAAGGGFGGRPERSLLPLLFCSEPRNSDGHAPAPGLRQPRATGARTRSSANPLPRPSTLRGAAATCSAAGPRRRDDALYQQRLLARRRSAPGPGAGRDTQAARGGTRGTQVTQAPARGRWPSRHAPSGTARPSLTQPRPEPSPPPTPTPGPRTPPHPAALSPSAPPAPLTPRRDERLPPAARRTKRRGVTPPPPAEQRGPGPPRPAPPAGTHLRARCEPRRFPPSSRCSRPPPVTHRAGPLCSVRATAGVAGGARCRRVGEAGAVSVRSGPAGVAVALGRRAGRWLSALLKLAPEDWPVRGSPGTEGPSSLGIPVAARAEHRVLPPPALTGEPPCATLRSCCCVRTGRGEAGVPSPPQDREQATGQRLALEQAHNTQLRETEERGNGVRVWISRAARPRGSPPSAPSRPQGIQWQWWAPS